MEKNVVLIGMPSCGKSTIAKILSAETGKERIEMDEELVTQMGMRIKEAFAQHGETWFRDQETLLCHKIGEKEGCIVSCGGGVVIREENIETLRKNGIVIWVDRSLESLHGDSSRPMVNSDEKIRQLYEERIPLYRHYAQYRVENNGNPEEAAERILKILEL